MKPLSRLDGVGAVLLVATALTWALGESGSMRHASGFAGGVVLALAAFKGAAIALDFMELREAPPLWRRFVLSWLVAVVGLIALIRGLGA